MNRTCIFALVLALTSCGGRFTREDRDSSGADTGVSTGTLPTGQGEDLGIDMSNIKPGWAPGATGGGPSSGPPLGLKYPITLEVEITNTDERRLFLQWGDQFGGSDCAAMGLYLAPGSRIDRRPLGTSANLGTRFGSVECDEQGNCERLVASSAELFADMPAVPADIFRLVEPGETFTYFIEGIEQDQWESGDAVADIFENNPYWQMAMSGFYVAVGDTEFCGETHPGCMCDGSNCRTPPRSPFCGDECETWSGADGAYVNSMGEYVNPGWYTNSYDLGIPVCGPALFLELEIGSGLNYRDLKEHFEWLDGPIGRWTTGAPVEDPKMIYK